MYAERVVPEESASMTTNQYITYKTKILYQIGLTDHVRVKEYLQSKCKNADNTLKKRIRIDNAARTMADAFYEGDMTFVETKRSAEQFMRILKRSFPQANALYEDVILHYVGKTGLDVLIKEHLIDVYVSNKGQKLYSI